MKDQQYVIELEILFVISEMLLDRNCYQIIKVLWDQQSVIRLNDNKQTDKKDIEVPITKNFTKNAKKSPNC